MRILTVHLQIDGGADIQKRVDMTFNNIMFSHSGNINLALFRPATQSTTDDTTGLQEASKAVDGKVGGSFYSSTALYDNQPWWKVQLANPVWVSCVEITNHESE